TVDFDPLAANEGKSIGLRQQALDFGLRQAFAIERHFQLEVQQSIQSEIGGSLAADRCLDLRAGRAVHAPVRWHANDDADAFERRNVFQELYGLLRLPAEGVENFT